MNVWTSHTLFLNGKLLTPVNLEEQCRIETNALAMQVLGFYREWIGENDEISLQTSGSTGKPKKMQVLKQSMIEIVLDHWRVLLLPTRLFTLDRRAASATVARHRPSRTC